MTDKRPVKFVAVQADAALAALCRSHNIEAFVAGSPRKRGA
jgi:hypothetical protein